MVLNTPESIIEQASTRNLLDYLINESVRTSARRPIMMQFDPRSGWIWKRWKGTVFSETWDSCVTKMVYSWVVFVLLKSSYPADADFLSGFSTLWGQLLSVTTFTLTFFVNQSYALWRKCYELSRRLQGRLHDLDMTLAIHARRTPGADPNQPTTYTSGSRKVLDLVSRWVRLFNLLTYASFTRSHRPILTPRGLRRLVERGLMTRKERKILVDADLPATQRHNAILLWIGRAFVEGCEAGHFQGGAGFENQFLEKVHVCRAQYGAIGDELQGRMPLAYCHIVQVLVDLVLWMYPVKAFSSGMSGFVCVLGTGLLTIGYQGLFDLAKQFLDPYDNESYGKGEDPLVVDTLIAETNSGSTRWLNSLDKFPVSSQLIQSGELQEDLLPHGGYTVEEWEQMEEQRKERERQLQEQLEREETARRLAEEHEKEVQEAAEALKELQLNATASSAFASFENARVGVTKPRDGSPETPSNPLATTDWSTGQQLCQFITDASALEGAFPEEVAAPGTSLEGIIRQKAVVEDSVDVAEEVSVPEVVDVEEATTLTETESEPKAGDSLVPVHNVEELREHDLSLAKEEASPDNQEEVISVGSEMSARAEDTLEVLGDVESLASQPVPLTDATTELNNGGDTHLPGDISAGEEGDSASAIFVDEEDSESIHETDTTEEVSTDVQETDAPKPGSLTLEDYERQVEEILQAEREELLETHAILNAPPAADSVDMSWSEKEDDATEEGEGTSFQSSSAETVSNNAEQSLTEEILQSTAEKIMSLGTDIIESSAPTEGVVPELINDLEPISLESPISSDFSEKGVHDMGEDNNNLESLDTTEDPSSSAIVDSEKKAADELLTERDEIVADRTALNPGVSTVDTTELENDTLLMAPNSTDPSDDHLVLDATPVDEKESHASSIPVPSEDTKSSDENAAVQEETHATQVDDPFGNITDTAENTYTDLNLENTKTSPDQATGDIGEDLVLEEQRMTAEEYERQREEILQAAEEELLETQAIMNAPPGAQSVDIPELSITNPTDPDEDLDLAVLEMDAPANLHDPESTEVVNEDITADEEEDAASSDMEDCVHKELKDAIPLPDDSDKSA